MADIQQAAKWADEGKKVRRPNFRGSDYCWSDRGSFVYHMRSRGLFGNNRYSDDWANLGTDDLLADDWEIAE